MPLQQSRLKTPVSKAPAKGPVSAPSDPIQRAWIALGRVSQAVQCHVEGELKKAGLPELSWYTVLWELERAGKPTRPKDLAIPLFILPYQLSRLVDRMEGEGLVKRIHLQGRQARPPAGADAQGFRPAQGDVGGLRPRHGRGDEAGSTTRKR